MPAIQRDGDANDVGGTTSGGIASVRVNGSPVTVTGNPVSAHSPWGRPHPPHAAASTTGGIGSVRAGGIPINVEGDADTCGHSRVGGSENVKAG